MDKQLEGMENEGVAKVKKTPVKQSPAELRKLLNPDTSKPLKPQYEALREALRNTATY